MQNERGFCYPSIGGIASQYLPIVMDLDETKPGFEVKIWKLGFSLQIVLRYLNHKCTNLHDDLNFVSEKTHSTSSLISVLYIVLYRQNGYLLAERKLLLFTHYRMLKHFL